MLRGTAARPSDSAEDQMRVGILILLTGVLPVVVNIALAVLIWINRGDWRPIVVLVAFYGVVYAACLAFASGGKGRRRRVR